MNYDRGQTVDDLVRRFADEQGLDLHPEADGPETGFSDMLCNMLHWLSQEVGIEGTVRALQDGIGAFAVEYGAHDDVAADGYANVTLKVTGKAGEDGEMRRFRIHASPQKEATVDGFVGSRSAFAVTKGHG
ncbi:MAG: hypothetical protein J0I99_00570 [Devosia sp.]|uniref:hypothetical protein n=1 Tax=Devosia sp. TaxID=1871048 RepID=UPI001AC6F0EF|nr:hypothetical protein [Devosia sp.]MBN9314210.1 hypothetical protein [Devosia sp.]